MHLDKPIRVLYFIFQHFLGKLTHDTVKLVCRIGWDYTPVKVFLIEQNNFLRFRYFFHLLFETFPYSQGCAKENFIPWRIILYARLHGTPTILYISTHVKVVTLSWLEYLPSSKIKSQTLSTVSRGRQVENRVRNHCMVKTLVRGGSKTVVPEQM